MSRWRWPSSSIRWNLQLISIKMIATTLTICAGFLLLSPELRSQIIFQDAGFTTPPSTAFTASNQYYYGTNPTNQYYYGNNPTTSSYYYNGYNPNPTTSSYYYNGNNPSVYIQTSKWIGELIENNLEIFPQSFLHLRQHWKMFCSLWKHANRWLGYWH